MSTLKLGTRGSRLALWQARYVANQLEKTVPGLKVEIRVIRTTGDRILDVALSRIGDKGLFTNEIENELLKQNIDLAVHSMKDLPSELAQGLSIGAVIERENPWDVLISHKGYKFEDLPPGAVIGTSSLRRIAQLKAYRSDISAVNIRGNVETRINKMKEQNLDGIILAYAGVKRLGFEEMITEILPCELMMPAVGQGGIAVEIREDDTYTLGLIEKINHIPTAIAVKAEREFLRLLEGGCQVPIASLAEIKNDKLILNGLVASLDGKVVYRAQCEGKLDEGVLVGTQLAEKLLHTGADKLLSEIRRLGEFQNE